MICDSHPGVTIPPSAATVQFRHTAQIGLPPFWRFLLLVGCSRPSASLGTGRAFCALSFAVPFSPGFCTHLWLPRLRESRVSIVFGHCVWHPIMVRSCSTMHLSCVVVLSTGTTDASLTVHQVRTIARPGAYHVCHSLHPPLGLASVFGVLYCTCCGCVAWLSGRFVGWRRWGPGSSLRALCLTPFLCCA